MEKEKVWDNEKSKNKENIVFLLLLNTRQKVVRGFSKLQVFGYLFSQSFFIL